MTNDRTVISGSAMELNGNAGPRITPPLNVSSGEAESESLCVEKAAPGDVPRSSLGSATVGDAYPYGLEAVATKEHSIADLDGHKQDVKVADLAPSKRVEKDLRSGRNPASVQSYASQSGKESKTCGWDLDYDIDELYFLIAKFLSDSPCTATAEVMLNELHEKQLLPTSYLWTGESKRLSFDQLAITQKHVASQHLPLLLQSLLQRRNREADVPVRSVLGRGCTSLLASPVSSLPSIHRITLPHCRLPIKDVSPVLFCRAAEVGGRFHTRSCPPTVTYKQFRQTRRIQGHLSAVYCAVFNDSGTRLVTGSDDHLVKVWNVATAQLLFTLRGHQGDITDLSVSYCNTFVASSANDNEVRVWEMETGALVAVIRGHTDDVNQVCFCPTPVKSLSLLMSVSSDGTCKLWDTDTWAMRAAYTLSSGVLDEASRPRGLCGSFSPGGTRLVCATSTGEVFAFEAECLSRGESEPDENDRYTIHTQVPVEGCHVGAITVLQFSPFSDRFVTGGEDGTAKIFARGPHAWSVLQAISLQPIVFTGSRSRPQPHLPNNKITTVTWMLDGCRLVTANNDHSIKVWESSTGELLATLLGHTDSVFVLDSHPTDARILMSAGYDGKVILWDVDAGTSVTEYTQPGNTALSLHEGRFSQDGHCVVATDSLGGFMVLIDGPTHHFFREGVHEEQFFMLDYEPVIYDVNGFVHDAQYNIPPHLVSRMQAPLVNRAGQAYEQQQPQSAIVTCVSSGRRKDVAAFEAAQRAALARSEGHTYRQLRRRKGKVAATIPPSQPATRLSSLKRTHKGRRRNRQAGLLAVEEDGDDGGADGDDVMVPYDDGGGAYDPLAEDDHIEEDSESSEQWDDGLLTSNESAGDSDASEFVPGRKRPRASGGRRKRRFKRNRQEQLRDGYGSGSSTARPSRRRKSSKRANEKDDMEWPSDFEESSSGATKGVSRWNGKGVRQCVPKTWKSSLVPEYHADWIQNTEPHRSYIPQLGDPVAYFWQGHKAFQENAEHQAEVTKPRQVGLLKAAPAASLPYNVWENLPPVLVCEVTDILYVVDVPHFCFVTLKLLPEHTGNARLTRRDLANISEFTVAYCVSDLSDYLVLASPVFLRRLTREWVVGERIRARFDDDWYMGTVAGYAESDEGGTRRGNFSPWESVLVRWDAPTEGDEEIMGLSPWELEPIGVDADGHDVIPVAEDGDNSISLPGDVIKRLVDGLERYMQLEHCQDFVENVDLVQYPKYPEVIAYPVAINTIVQRLRNNVYRSVEAVLFDAKHIAINAARFNQKNSDIVAVARTVSAELCSFISDPSRRDVVVPLEESVDEALQSCDEGAGQEMDAKEEEASGMAGGNGDPDLPVPLSPGARRARLLHRASAIRTRTGGGHGAAPGESVGATDGDSSETGDGNRGRNRKRLRGADEGKEEDGRNGASEPAQKRRRGRPSTMINESAVPVPAVPHLRVLSPTTEHAEGSRRSLRSRK